MDLFWYLIGIRFGSFKCDSRSTLKSIDQNEEFVCYEKSDSACRSESDSNMGESQGSTAGGGRKLKPYHSTVH